MLPGKLTTLELYRGTPIYESYIFNYKEAGSLLPLDLRQYDSIRCQVKRKDHPFQTPIYELSLGDGITISGDNFNVLTLIHTSEKTSQITADGTHHRDLLFIQGTQKITLCKGKLNVTYNNTEP